MASLTRSSESGRPLPFRIWDETKNFLATRKGIQTFLNLGIKSIDWAEVFSRHTMPSSLDNTRELLYDAKSIISVTNYPDKTERFGYSLTRARKQPTANTVSDAVLIGLAFSSSCISLGAKVLRAANIGQLSKAVFKSLKFYGSIVSLASSGKGAVIKTTQIFNQVRDLNASPEESKNEKKHMLLDSSLKLYTSGSKFGLSMLAIASLIGARIAPLVFLIIGTSSLACSVFRHYHYEIAVRPKK